jgi:hypothetical protein
MAMLQQEFINFSMAQTGLPLQLQQQHSFLAHLLEP